MKNKKRINQKIRQFLTLGIVILLICPFNLAAKRKGSQLMIVKEDGQVLEGELLKVKEDSLLIMTSGSGNGVTIDITEISKLKIKRKAKFGKGALKGLLLGAGIGIVVGLTNEYDGTGFIKDKGGGAIVGGLWYGVLGAGAGGVIGSMTKDYKEIQVKGKTPSQIKEIMRKLNKKARFGT